MRGTIVTGIVGLCLGVVLHNPVATLYYGTPYEYRVSGSQREESLQIVVVDDDQSLVLYDQQQQLDDLSEVFRHNMDEIPEQDYRVLSGYFTRHSDSAENYDRVIFLFEEGLERDDQQQLVSYACQSLMRSYVQDISDSVRSSSVNDKAGFLNLLYTVGRDVFY